jgi:putative ABC transport system permease protein
VVGTRIVINGNSHLLAGVLPPTYDDVLSPTAQIWRVLGYGADQPWACRTCRHLRMLGRVHAGVTPELASQEVDAALKRLAAAHPNEYSAPGGTLVPLRDMVVADVRPILFAVSGAAAILLLFAIVNVTHLQFARAIRREGEFAIRMALGATRLRLTRQLLAEAVVIVMLSTALGLIVAVAATPMLVSRLPVSLPRLSAVSVDGTTLMLLALIGACSTVLIGMLPSWRTEGALADGLRGGRRAATSMRRSARNVLVVTQVALALVLMIGAGLLGRSLLRLYEVDTGFDARNVLTMQVQSTGARYDSTQRIFAHHDALVASISQLPGVVSAAFINQLPMGGNFDSYSVNADDKPLANPELAPSADRYTVSPGFTSTMGIGILQGRALTLADNRDSAHAVAVVSASLAARIWPGESAIGKRIRVGGAPDAPWREVVGIAANVRHDGLDSDRTLQVYVPYRQWFFADDIVTLVVRTTVEPRALQQAIVDAVRRIDPSQPIMHIATMEQVIARSVAQRRLALELFGAFALLAVMLAGAGLYGLLAGDVADRTREIGIRVAMGARPVQVLSLVARQASLLLATGALVGAAGAMALGRYLEALLYGVRPMDTVTLLGVAGALVIVGVLSTLVPVLRALHIEPSVALRYE